MAQGSRSEGDVRKVLTYYITCVYINIYLGVCMSYVCLFRYNIRDTRSKCRRDIRASTHTGLVYVLVHDT